MPIDDFLGRTFVAYTDISGFKEMMKDEKRAIAALDRLYATGFNLLQHNLNVNGFFVSDCGILFSRSEVLNDSLQPLLDVVERLNRAMLTHDVMLTTSIAFGDFSYHQRLEFTGIEKNLIYGNAYIAAFLDNENGQPKIQPGECRVLETEMEIDILPRNARLVRKKRYWYFHWMVNDPGEIAEFQNKYSDAYQLKYRGMIDALKWRGLPLTG